MSQVLLDSSAIAKRYLSEVGTDWVPNLVLVTRGTGCMLLSEITVVEVAAALAARHRTIGGLSKQQYIDSLKLFLHHCDTDYMLLSVTRTIIETAVRLTQSYRLRGYDAVQLATALQARSQALASGLPDLLFVAADDDLLTAASAEGLVIENPNHHP